MLNWRQPTKRKIYAKGINDDYQCGVYDNSDYSNPRKNINELTQCNKTTHLNFKSIYANKNFSAAITVDNQLYIWGYINEIIKIPSIVKNRFNKQLIFDEVYLGNNNELFAVVKILENGNYIKKIVTLEERDDYYDYYEGYYYDIEKNNPYILNEIKLFNAKYDNSRIIPIKL